MWCFTPLKLSEPVWVTCCLLVALDAPIFTRRPRYCNQQHAQQLWPMVDDTVLGSDNGLESNFGLERQSNPYVGGT
jgi:hypothetical protein